jgi:hypothetical protein
LPFNTSSRTPSCNVVFTFFCFHATFRVIINGTNPGF